MLDISLEDLDTIEIKIKRGIYFLFKNMQLVYIGQTANVLGRIYQHLSEKTKEFDSYKFLELNGNINLDVLEKELIIQYKPSYNTQYNSKSYAYRNRIKKIKGPKNKEKRVSLKKRQKRGKWGIYDILKHQL